MAKDIIIRPGDGIIEFQDKTIYDGNDIEQEQCFIAHPTGSLNHNFKLTYDTTTRRLNFLDDNSAEVFRIDASDNNDGLMVRGDSSITGSLTVKSQGSTSATTSLLLQNSNGCTILQALDNGNIGIGGNAQTATYKLRVYGALWADSL